MPQNSATLAGSSSGPRADGTDPMRESLSSDSRHTFAATCEDWCLARKQTREQESTAAKLSARAGVLFQYETEILELKLTRRLEEEKKDAWKVDQKYGAAAGNGSGRRRIVGAAGKPIGNIPGAGSLGPECLPQHGWRTATEPSAKEAIARIAPCGARPGGDHSQ